MTSNSKILCDEKIQKRSDFRKWSLKNHPDKIGPNAGNRYGRISYAVNKLLPTNTSFVNCDEHTKSSPQQQNSPEENYPEFDKANIDMNKAKCVRNTENWSKILNYHRFDKQSFNKQNFKKDIQMMSPKIDKLLQNIRQIDDNDMKNNGKYYKHFIFSDVQNGGYGAKIIASALIANDFNHCLTQNLQIVIPQTNDRNETFGILSSTSIYNKSFTQKHVKSILDIYNQRPFNVNGQNMRFIVLDSGFKEGIDLFDVKYVHIFENQATTADLIQAVGRATRSCGQKGLNFVENVGWKLNVYEYSLVDENNDMVFNKYMKYAGIDLSKNIISNNIEKVAIEAAVDFDLNYNINKFNNQYSKSNYGTPSLELQGGDGPFDNCNNTITNKQCGKRSTKYIPFTIKQFTKAYNAKLPDRWKTMNGREKRKFFCHELEKNKEFCINMNKSFPNRTQNKKQLIKYDESSTNKNIVIKKEFHVEVKEQENRLDMLEDMKTMEDMSFVEFQRYINKTFSRYKYEPIRIENLCDKSNISKIVKFTESQEFVHRYFVPSIFTKGLFIWHSVGTGKTCTAVSLKSFLFERLDYSVIWVTRRTLKDDVWKNMYDNICDHVIRSKYKKGDERDNLKSYLSKKFIPPMSYKQFSNMLNKKNDLYQRLVKQNGSTDILSKTLVIIDEAHKLYSNSLPPMEQPDMQVVEQKIKSSKSCKLILMTGTPITKDPMEFIKLLNLLIKTNPFPTDIDQFKSEFMMNNSNKFSKEGILLFKNKTKGLISYLNRRFDPRQFAQPVFYKINVPLSVSSMNQNECITEAKNKFDNCTNNIADNSESINQQIFMLSQQILSLNEEINNTKNELKFDKKNENLKMLLNMKKGIMNTLKNDLKVLKTNKVSNNRYVKKLTNSCSKLQNQQIRSCKKEQLDNNYQNLRFEKC